MANGSTSSRRSTHFFQPLLPGFQSHLKIPIKFFSEHIEGKHEGKTVKLISDASERTWEVKMEDHRLTFGWKEFAEAHDLRIGDIVVFRHEGDMLFHVTALGTSCCEIQYSPSHSHEEDEESDEIEISSRSENEVEENVNIESGHQSSSDLNCFSQSVTASNVSRDSVRVPIDFANRNGLNKGRQEIVLMNEEGKSWASELKTYSCRVFIVRGWTSFCTENKLKIGDSCTFRLLPNTETPVFQLCSRTKAERKRQTRSEEDYVDNKIGENRFLKLTLTLGSLEHGKQHLPVSFTRVNMLNKPGKIILVDKDKVEWPMKLTEQGSEVMYIYSAKGWKSFCAANVVGAGESLTLELIRGGTTPLLKFCSKMEEPPSEADDETQKRARVQKWSQETRPKTGIREKTDAEGEPSRASNKFRASGNQNLQHTRPCSVSDQVAKVKQNVVDNLTSIRRFRTEFETMEQKLEVSLQEIYNLERGEDKWE